MIKTFDQYIKQQKELLNYKKETLSKIDDYVKLYLTHITHYKYCTNFFHSHDDEFIISYINSYDDSNTITFKKDDSYEKIKQFIDNPELYKNTNKYNL